MGRPVRHRANGRDPRLATQVEFWAEWAGPSRMVAATLDEIAGAYEGRLVITKLNIDHNTTTPPTYDISALPTLLLFKNGTVTATRIGALSRGQIEEFLDANL
ncbi:thioredoxin domain-containing protein [Streptomyces sp. NBC_00690]|uniref:thioredoxin domain-containing protein n=1 Tax=Streptomyces sp. NBC_00690 TaxID=2975808 RepID=UPI002E2B15B6|nr:thioredoxin domain-containing protein [Streptomyces sp. NBC_00690]